MGAAEFKSCCSTHSSPRQVSAPNVEKSNVNNINSTEPTSPLDSAIQCPPLPRKAKRKNHRGGKRTKKVKGKKTSTCDAERSEATCSKKDFGNVEKQGIVSELESEAASVAKAEVLLCEGKCNEGSTPAAYPIEDRLNVREEGASPDDGDGASAMGDLDAVVNKSENESITPESITTTISTFNDMVISHSMEGGATGAKEALTVATGEDAATTVEETKATTTTVEDETAVAGKQEAVVVEPSAEKADAAVVGVVNVEKEPVAVEVIAAVAEEDAVQEGRDATVAVEQDIPIEAADISPVVGLGGYDTTADQNFTTRECQTNGDDGGGILLTQETILAKYKDESQQRVSPAVPEASCRPCNPSIGMSRIRTAVDCMYEIKLAPGKGLGMFAMGTIQRGTRIIEEEALMAVSEMSYLAVLPSFAGLEPEQKTIFMELAGAEDEEEAENLAWYLAEADKNVAPSERIPMSYEDQAAVQLIFGSNSFNMDAHTSGIFPIASRMNHSCIPNVYHTWNKNINRLTVHALRNIAPGEELLTTYISAILTREQRNDEEHLGNYGFTCNCPACDPKSNFFKQSVFRRASAVAIEERLASYFASITLGDAFVGNTGSLSCFEALRYAQLRANLLMKEGTMNMDLVKCIHEAGELALLCGELEEARTCAKTAVWLTETCAGKDSPHMAVLRNQLIEAEQKLRLCCADDGQQGRRVCV